MAETTVMSLRLDPVEAEQIELIAAIDGQTISDAIRAAIRAHVAARKADRDGRAAAQPHLDLQRRALLGDDHG